jgi:hypothetical protein
LRDLLLAHQRQLQLQPLLSTLSNIMLLLQPNIMPLLLQPWLLLLNSKAGECSLD